MKWPKYKTMPIALLIYFVAMAVYGIVHNGGKLPPDFWLISCIELVILVALFFLLRYQYKRKAKG